jgi:multiple sugar transport system permease protein
MSQQTASVPVPTARELAAARQHQRRGRFSMEGTLAMALLVLCTIYFLVPYFWLIVSSTKNAGDLFGTFGFWFAPNFSLFSNLQQLFTYQDSVFLHWLLNSFLYAGVGALVGTWLASMAGYALAKYVFPGRNLLFSLVIGSLLVPVTALALPL